MKWPAQVAHIARKDLLMTRWYVAGYAALVAIASAAALDLGSVLNPLWSILLVLLGLIGVLIVIQSDSPYRIDALWASKPLSATGVLAAKLLYITLIVIGIGLVGQAAVLLFGFELGAGDFSRIMLASALTYGSSLLGAVIIASVTPDVRSVILIYIANIVFTNTVVMYVLVKLKRDVESIQLPIAVAIPAFLATLVLLVQVYRTRSRRLGIGLFVMSSVVFPIVMLGLFPQASVEPSTSKSAPLELQGSGFDAWRTGVTRTNGENLLHVYGQISGGSPHHAYVIVAARVEVERERSATVRIPVTRPVFVSTPLPPNVNGVRWMEDSRAPFAAAGMYVRVSRRQASALSNSNKRVLLRARIEVLESRISATVPLARGKVAVNSGQRLKILSTYPDDLSVAAWRVAQHSVPEHGINDVGRRVVEFAMMNRPLREAVVLRREGSTGGSGLVIPGGGGVREKVQLTTEDVFRKDRFEPVMGWLANAELLRIEWRSVGSYPVTVDLPLRTSM
jgi:hypothetical protein